RREGSSAARPPERPAQPPRGPRPPPLGPSGSGRGGGARRFGRPSFVPSRGRGVREAQGRARHEGPASAVGRSAPGRHMQYEGAEISLGSVRPPRSTEKVKPLEPRSRKAPNPNVD
ncbi:unnamed protein product, partial [Prorocentrum cordatum]